MNLAFVLCLTLISIGTADQNVPIPKKPLGFSIGDQLGTLQVECFIDLQCDDSQQTYYSLKEVFRSIDLERMRIKFTYQLNPLTYHFYATKVNSMFYYVWNKLGANAAEKYIDLMFGKLNELSAQKWLDKTVDEYLNNLSSIISTQFNLNLQEVRKQLQPQSQSRTTMIYQWKYNIGSNFISGTPICKANGARIDGAQNYRFTQWLNFFKTNTM